MGNVYGQALYDLTKAEQCTEQVRAELTALQESFRQEPSFLKLLAGANLSKEEKRALLDESFQGKVHPYLLNFLKLLSEKGYAKHFSDCAEAYVAQYYSDHNILPVTAITAVALTQVQAVRLQERLEKLTGKKISLTNRIDPEILGGVRLDYDGKRLEDTVANRLDAIRKQLTDAVL